MAGLLDLLLSSAGIAPQSTQGAAPAGDTTPVGGAPPIGADPAASAPPPVSGVDVTAASPRANATHLSAYDNNPEVQAIKGVEAQYQPPDAMGIPGALGMHGSMRNLLGTLGDAFLIQSGHQPLHQQQMQREQLADSMAGFQDNPAVAAGRVAATPVPGAPEMADKIYQNYQTQQLRQQQQEYTNQWRNAQQGDKVNQQMQRITPYVGAIANDPSIKTKDDYTKAYNRGVSMAQRIDPNATGADVGLVDPEDWAPGVGSTSGMTAGQVARNQTGQASIAERANASAARNATAIRGQNMTAGRPTSPGITQAMIDKQNSGQTLTPAEQQVWDAQTARGKPKTKLNIPGLTVATPGGRPAPSASDLAYVRAHPESRAAFQSHFGIAPQ